MSGTNRQLAEHKLILLYIIDNFDSPLNNIEIMQIVLENKFMNYFVFQETLGELCRDKFVISSNYDNKTYYSTTPDGRKSLCFFDSLIPQGIKHRIDDLIAVQKENDKLNSFVFANYEKTDSGECNLICSINQKTTPLFNLKLSLSDENTAQLICSNWKNYFQEIYPEMIELLTKVRKTKI